MRSCMLQSAAITQFTSSQNQGENGNDSISLKTMVEGFGTSEMERVTIWDGESIFYNVAAEMRCLW